MSGTWFVVSNCSNEQGWHLAFLSAKSAKFGLFKNCLLEIKWFGHFGHFWPFLMLTKIVYFKVCFGQISKFQTFYEILSFNLVILTHVLNEIWPLFGLFSFFRILSFLKLLLAF